MAYAALKVVMFAIRELLDSPCISIASSTKKILKRAYNQAWNLETTFSSFGQVVTASDEGEMIDEARRLQDAIEFAVAAQFLEQSKPNFSLNLDHLKKDADRFAEIVWMMSIRIEELWEQKLAKTNEEDLVKKVAPHKEDEDEDVSASATDMVGLCDEFQILRDDYAQPPNSSSAFFRKYMVLWISGMAGVGKTAIAERIYHDPLVKANFQSRAFVKVGQCYQLDRVFRAITVQLNRDDDDMKMMMEAAVDNESLQEIFRTTLRAKRCLIVLDDVWDDNVLKNVCDPALEDRASRILVTSRKETFFPFEKCGWKMRLLNKEESWELLKAKVFDEEEEVCPPLLVKPGKKIAENCDGLPLLIIAVAGILRSKVEKNPESWNRVAEKPNSVLEEASHQISEVLITSYHHIHEIYRLHFLYIAAFPQSYVAFRSTLANLWYAEGFYHLVSSHCDRYEYYVFEELHKNNLVITCSTNTWPGNRMKTFRLQCAYWYLCKRLAKDNRFLNVMNSYADGMDNCVESHHRLAIQTNVLLAVREVGDRIASISTIRSMMFTGPYHQYQLPVCFEWKLLRVLDALAIRFYEFPAEVVKLIHLRYLALTCNANLPPSISKLWRLQFLILHQHLRIRQFEVEESFVPAEIWDLQELIHLEIMGKNLPHPPNPGMSLPNLEQLLDVGVKSCTKEVLESIPKLKKLRVQIELAPNANETLICFNHIACVDYLLSFQSSVINPTLWCRRPPLSIPILGIQKLSLSGFGYSWEEMRKIAKLPFLFVLKLRCYAFRGEKWEVNEEMRLSSLRYLYIEDTDLVQWTVTEGKNMPYLDRLIMKNCHKLHEIPMLPSTQLRVELVDCNPIAENCAKQMYTDPNRATVIASYSWKKKLKSS